MKKIAESAIAMLQSGKSFAHAVILESSGSTPREAGAGMLIFPDKSIVGTVGGGVLEAHIQNTAQKVIESCTATVVEYVLEESGAAAIGAVCGGRAKVLIDFVSADNQDNTAFFEQLLEAARSNKRSHIAVLIPGSNKLSQRNICLILSDGTIIGAAALGVALPSQLQSGPSGYDVFTKLENFTSYLFPVGSDGTVYIFGAGHCGEKLAHIIHTVCFETVVIDDRSEFANTSRLPEVDEILVPKKLDEPFDSISFGPDSYIVIVTRGHLHDEIVLRRALKTDAGYIGMIGSKKKRETIYQHLLQDGFAQADIDKVHSPIGISIGADTPEEIAISIAAELIRVRAEKKVK